MPSLGPLTSYLIVHPAARLVSGPLQGQGALFSMESTSLEGAARIWAGVWGLLCLGLCSTSGCLGACHSRPFVPLLGSAEAPSWAVSTAQGTGAGE